MYVQFPGEGLELLYIIHMPGAKDGGSWSVHILLFHLFGFFPLPCCPAVTWDPQPYLEAAAI